MTRHRRTPARTQRPALVLERSRTVYRGRIITVNRDTVRNGDGRRLQMDVVRHRGSVVLLPQPDPATIILIRQYRYVIGRWMWEVPAGTLEPGEAPARAARRECLEETGFRPKTIEKLGVYYPTPGFCDEKLTFYACRDLVRPRRPVANDPDEEIEAKVVTLREAWRMVERGDIVDLKTAAGLAMLDGHLRTGTRRRRG